MTLTNVAFFVPGEPQGKGRGRVVKIAGHSRIATPAKTVAYEGLVAHAAAEAMRGAVPMQGACTVELRAAFAVPASWPKKRQAEALAGRVYPTKKPDADNVIKAVLDGMNGVVWRDDVQAVRVVLEKCYAERPGVFVNVAEV